MTGELFHPSVNRWFNRHYPAPTDIQAKAWPEIKAGRNLLITAPTGSGKTLTAFLWALNQFATGALATGATRVLYISPLKALNNDIQRNLLTPLAGLKETFAADGVPMPQISVQTRSGDTDPDARRRMLRHPPEILITTPESLNLMLTTASARNILQSVATVILDEIHAIVDDKRGVYLMTAIERLAGLSGDFQRLALSATVNPLEAVADFVAGYRREGEDYTRRDIRILRSQADKAYDIRVVYPDATVERPEDEQIWLSLARDFVARIEGNRSTLLFVNSRALCEKITYLINQEAGRTLAWSHHGSLSREIRQSVEQNLKAGRLAAIVATGTLEMGIDIGELDEVLLVQAPGSIAATIQRIGRAGHNVGDTSRATVYPTHPRDLIEACVLSRAVIERDLEAIALVSAPLDVLAQVIVSMCAGQTWDLTELYNEVRCSHAYRHLSRTQFDLVIEMLAGRYADNHVRDLRPRVNVDRMAGTIESRRGAVLSLYLSGGVIPDRGYFQLRHAESGARIGDLDEEFVWEANVGQVFSFGTQHWRVQKITHNDVLVKPGKPDGIAPPFWKSEPISRSFHYAERVGEFLAHAEHLLASDGKEELLAELQASYHADSNTAKAIVDFLARQRAHTGAPLPSRHHLLLENINRGPGGAEGSQIVLHTGWGARVNRPLAMALEGAWLAADEQPPRLHVDNDCLVLQLPGPMGMADLLGRVPSEDIEKLLRHRLEGSGFFGARFRENAGRALLLSRGRFNERKPLWMSRLQSEKLLEATLGYEDFPIMLETWRTCLNDEFDLPVLHQLLDEIRDGVITATEITAQTPSPFAQSLAWDQINTYMYEDDSRQGQARSSQLNPGLLDEVIGNAALRPPLPPDLVLTFEARRQRRLPGYQVEDLTDLIEWVKERTLVPVTEWRATTELLDNELLDGELPPLLCRNDHFIHAAEDDARVAVLRDDLADLATDTVSDVTIDTGADASADTSTDTSTILANVLQYYGPVNAERLAMLTGMALPRIIHALGLLYDEGTLVHGNLLADDAGEYWCDSRNYEALLRQLRNRHRLDVPPQPLSGLPAFLHAWQQRLDETEDRARLFDATQLLRCLPLPAALWETEVLPARCPGYQPELLDALFTDNALGWHGHARETLSLQTPVDLDLLPAPSETLPAIVTSLGEHRRTFGELQDASALSADVLTGELWAAAWAGFVTSDTFASVRRGLENRFQVPSAVSMSAGQGRRLRRGSFNQWRSALPMSGYWSRVTLPEPADDLLEREELNKDRVRVLLDRYGIVFRELLLREAPEFQWRTLFRSLRLMELSGEVATGYFFNDVPGPQFIDPAALRLLQDEPDRWFWLNAADPISPCGLGLPVADGLPRRVAGNHLVYHGKELALVSERRGQRLTFHIEPAAVVPACLDVFHHLLHRAVQPLRQVVLTEINGEPARSSPYLPAFETRFRVVRDHRGVYLEREM